MRMYTLRAMIFSVPALVAFISGYGPMQVARAQDEKIRIDSLTVQQAVGIALEYHPSIKASRAAASSAAAGHKQALAGYLPSIEFTGSAQQTQGAFVFNPSFPPRDQAYSSYTAGFQFQQLLFDFSRTTGRTSAAGDLEQASGNDLEASRQTVILNVQIAYYGVLQAEQVVTANEEAREQAARHLAEAKAFFSVGTRPQYDVTKSEVDLANAEVALISARNQLRLARVQLENAMGIQTDRQYKLVDSFMTPSPILSLDSARNVALRERPELRSALARVSANEALATSARSQHLPSLSAFGGYTWTNFSFPLFNRWNAGVSVSLPVFQGFSLDAQVEQADANTDAAIASLDLLRQSVFLEVEQAYLSLKEAEERTVATSKLVAQANENLVLAERQYAAGVGTLLEVTDAKLVRTNARITTIQALYDYNSWLVRLQKAMGLSER